MWPSPDGPPRAGHRAPRRRARRCRPLRARRPAEPGEYDACDLEEGPAHSVDQMEAGLRELVGMTQNSFLRELLERFFAQGSAIWERWREAPAAKRYHQAYKHGLLEHS